MKFIHFADAHLDSPFRGLSFLPSNQFNQIKKATENRFLTITPGIRPFGEESSDQKRVATLQEAKEAMSDFVVIGRPIYKAEEPLKMVEKILNIECMR